MACCDCKGCKCDKKISVRFCPKCKGFKVKYVQGLSNLLGLIPKQKCLDCGFEAPAFPVLVTTEGRIKEAVEKLKKKSKIAVSKVEKLEKKIIKGNLVGGSDIILCPKCKSKNVKPKMRWKGDSNIECLDCGYEGETFLIKTKKAIGKKAVKKAASKKKVIKKKAVKKR